MRVELQYFDDCPNWRTAEDRLRRLQREHGFELALVRLAGDEEASDIGFRGSPTILVEGVDPFPGASIGHLACRMYAADGAIAGVPSESQLRRAITGEPI